MIHYILGERKVSIASLWDEISIDQFLKIISVDYQSDPCSLLAILSNTERELWFNARADEGTFETINIALDFLKEKIDWHELPVPDEIMIGEKKVRVPKDLSVLSLGQRYTFEALCMKKQVNEESGTITVTAKPDYQKAALAVYLMPEYTGEKFTDAKLDQFIALCGSVKAKDAWPIATFFLLRYFGLNPKSLKSVIPLMSESQKKEKSASLNTAS